MSLKKCSVRINSDDLQVIQEHYRDIGYNNIIRHLCHRLAESIRRNRANALQNLEREIDNGEL